MTQSKTTAQPATRVCRLTSIAVRLATALEDGSASGTVHSVFQRSLNWCDGLGRMWSLLDDGYGKGPFAACGPIGDLLAQRPVAREVVDCSPRAVVLPESGLALDLSGVTRWNPRVRVIPCGGAARAADVAAGILARTILDADAAAALKSQQVAAFGRASARMDADEVARAALDLLGLGPGLTPLGDDLLTGAFGSWSAVAPALGRESWVGRVARHVRPALEAGTTRVAREYLACALNGELSEQLGDLVRAVALGAVADAEMAAQRLVKVGASSGFALVLGVVTAWRATAAHWAT